MTSTPGNSSTRTLEVGVGDGTLASADMALAGQSCLIPADEVIESMYKVGRRLPVEFRETALGGIAATPSGHAVVRAIYGEETGR